MFPYCARIAPHINVHSGDASEEIGSRLLEYISEEISAAHLPKAVCRLCRENIPCPLIYRSIVDTDGACFHWYMVMLW